MSDTSATKSAPKSLSPAKQKRLNELETIVSQGDSVLVQMCNALLQIEREHLYVPHQTMAAYCAFRWDFDKSETSKYLDAAQAIEAIQKKELAVPTNMHQAYWLWKVADKKAGAAIRIWKKVLAKAKDVRISAQLIKDVAGYQPAKRTAKKQATQTPTTQPTLKVVGSDEIDLQGVILGLSHFKEALPKNQPKMKDADLVNLRKQLQAAEKLIEEIKGKIG